MPQQDGGDFALPAPAREQTSAGSRESAPNVLQSMRGRSGVDSRIRGAINGSLAEAISFEDDEDPRPTQKAMRALSEKLAKFEKGKLVAGDG